LALQVLLRRLDRLSLPVSTLDQRLDAGPARGDEGELGRHEERVRRDEEHDRGGAEQEGC
jgi:hypothetical protein